MHAWTLIRAIYHPAKINGLGFESVTRITTVNPIRNKMAAIDQLKIVEPINKASSDNYCMKYLAFNFLAQYLTFNDSSSVASTHLIVDIDFLPNGLILFKNI